MYLNTNTSTKKTFYTVKQRLALILLSLPGTCLAQNTDSIPKKINAYLANKFPSTRVLNIEHYQLASHRFNSALLNGPEISGKITNTHQTKINLNANFLQKAKWSLSGSFNYRYIGSTVAYQHPFNQSNIIGKADYHYHSSSLNFSYFSKLMDKMMIYSSSFTIDGSEKGFERAKIFLNATMVLKANLQSKIALGLVGIVDPSAQIPVIPTFALEHRFKENWVVDFVFPQRLLLKKEIFNNGRISLGSELDGTSFYLYSTSPIAQTHEFRQIEINTGAIYEHYFGGSLIGTVKTGLKNITSGRAFEKSKSFDNYELEAKPNGVMYLNLGISFNPFNKSVK